MIWVILKGMHPNKTISSQFKKTVWCNTFWSQCFNITVTVAWNVLVSDQIIIIPFWEIFMRNIVYLLNLFIPAVEYLYRWNLIIILIFICYFSCWGSWICCCTWKLKNKYSQRTHAGSVSKIPQFCAWNRTVNSFLLFSKHCFYFTLHKQTFWHNCRKVKFI